MSAAKCRKSNEEREKLRQQVMKNIRALLISAPSGLTVAEIQSDHQSMIGKPLPYRELGYNNALELIKDLPDVCRPTHERGVLVLKCEYHPSGTAKQVDGVGVGVVSFSIPLHLLSMLKIVKSKY